MRLGYRWQAGWPTALLALACLVSACGGSSTGASPGRLYQQARNYTACMRSHGVPDFPEPKPGPDGSLNYPVNPPAGMLTSSSYPAAYRACLSQVVTGGRPKAQYQALALRALHQAECMRAHGIADAPFPAALNGGIHDPSGTGPDTHTLRYQAAGKACRVLALWQQVWWWGGSGDAYQRAAG
jgi:hypothetical protein